MTPPPVSDPKDRPLDATSGGKTGGGVRPIDGGVTAPLGFRASGVSCGIKLRGKRDLALIVSDAPATAAGVLTMNRLAAAPIHLQQRECQRLHGPARPGGRRVHGHRHGLRT